jgi:voltage-dependent calcium channel alpha-2/delta-3
LGCEKDLKYRKGTRAYVLISQPIEEYWRTRPDESVKEVKWTYVGMRTGVFRTYPGHRSNRLYNPVSRSWYKRALNAHLKTTLSSPYLDAAGAGKIITISQAVFEGMKNESREQCNLFALGKKPSGCHCKSGEDCESGVCYVSKAPGPDPNLPRCATNRLIAVTGTDLGYNDFQAKIMEKMTSSDPGGMKSCSKEYKCPDGFHTCQTRCYLFDTNAILIMAPEFNKEKDLEEKKYSQVNLGIIEGEIMKDLIYRHQFLKRSENIDFSGTCTISPYQPKVTLEGIPINPEDQDNYYKNRGPIPSFQNEYGCIQDAVRYLVNASVLGPHQTKILIGNVSGPCMSGFYYVTALPKTNLFLLVIENWQDYKESFFYNFNCRIARK